MKEDNLKWLFNSLLSHASQIRENKTQEFSARWQKITEDEKDNFKEDYDKIKQAKLKLNQNITETVWLGLFTKEAHYKFLYNVFFKVLSIILVNYNVDNLYIGNLDEISKNNLNLDTKIIFENENDLNKVLNRILEFKPDYLVIRVTKKHELILNLGVPKWNNKEQVIYE